MTLRFFALANLDAALAERNCECLRGGRDASPALRDIERAFARAAGRDDVTDDDDEEEEEEEEDDDEGVRARSGRVAVSELVARVRVDPPAPPPPPPRRRRRSDIAPGRAFRRCPRRRRRSRRAGRAG